MILTAIVITMGIAAFVLSLIYRTYRLTTAEEVVNDPEDTRVAQAHRRGSSPPSTRRRPTPDEARDTDEPDELDALPGLGGVAMRGQRERRDRLRGVDPAARADPDDRRGGDAGRRAPTPTAAGHHADRVVGGGRGVRCAALSRRPRRHAWRCTSAAGDRACAGMGPLGITLVVDRLSALMLVVSSIVLLAVVLYAIGQGIRDGDERQPVSIFLPTYLVLSAGVCNAFLAGDLFNLFVGFRGAAGGELRAADHRGEHRAGPGRHLLRDGFDGVVDDLPDRHRAGVRGDRHTEHGRARRPAGRGRRRVPAARCSRCCSSRSASRRRCSRCRPGCPTPTRPHRRPSPRCSPAC